VLLTDLVHVIDRSITHPARHIHTYILKHTWNQRSILDLRKSCSSFIQYLK